ncbi:hypothetical protein Aperf_G00000098924 [Anoplocephala perfoliata]
MPKSNPTTNSEDEYDLRQCAEWLNRCRIIPDDHPTLLPDGCGLPLLQTLMDGVKICHLLNVLTNGDVDPRKMKDFSPQTQQSPFLCCQNIRLFVKLCEEEFGIDKKHLIEPSDLYHAKNFGKVIELLSRLSRSPRALLSGIPGFPPENGDLQSSREYYNNLKDIAASMEDMQIAAESNYADLEEETNEIVYDTIVHGGKSTTAQAESVPTSPRSFCIKEIVSTEKNYVDVLKMLIEKYKWPLSKCLSSQELEEIFKYIEDLHCIHRELLSNLSLAVSTTLAVMTIGEVFIKIRDRLLIYGEYCGHVQKAQTLVLEITKNDIEKRTKIQECQAQSDNYSKFHLTELLTVPMQRVLKYHLLLEQLCKLTDDDHPEKPELQTALDGMRELAQTINEVKRDLDTISAIDQIQASLLEVTLFICKATLKTRKDPSLGRHHECRPPDKKLSSYGRRHIDGELRVLNHLDSKTKIRYVFLFDKILLLCKSKMQENIMDRSSSAYHHVLSVGSGGVSSHSSKGDNYTFMAAYHIVNGAPQALGLPSKKGGKFPYEFTIPIAGERDDDVQLTFFAKSEELRNAWIKATETALSNQFPPGAKDNGYQFEMATFKQTTYCCMCKKLLQGVFYQGYQCRETGLAAHKACLVNVPTLLPPRTSIFLANGVSAAHHRSSNSHFFRASMSSVPTPPPPHSAIGSNPHIQPLHRISRNTSSVSTDSAISASPHLRPGSSSSETIGGGDVSSSRPMVVTSVTEYMGEPPPPHPLTNMAPLGDAVKKPKPLCFGVGEKITLLQPFDGSRWLQGRLNDQEGWFPASHVDILLKSDRPLATMSRQISRDCVSRVISPNDVVTPPISPPSFWGPSLTHESPAETPTADDTIGLHFPTTLACTCMYSFCPLSCVACFLLSSSYSSGLCDDDPRGTLKQLPTPPPGSRKSFSSVRTELPPIPSSSFDGSLENGVTRSSSLRTYAAPNVAVSNNNAGLKTTPGRHHSCAPAPSSPSSSAISSMSWYYGEMDRAEATQLLKGCEDGTFLVRISKNVSRMATIVEMCSLFDEVFADGSCLLRGSACGEIFLH